MLKQGSDDEHEGMVRLEGLSNTARLAHWLSMRMVFF